MRAHSGIGKVPSGLTDIGRKTGEPNIRIAHEPKISILLPEPIGRHFSERSQFLLALEQVRRGLFQAVVLVLLTPEQARYYPCHDQQPERDDQGTARDVCCLAVPGSE